MRLRFRAPDHLCRSYSPGDLWDQLAAVWFLIIQRLLIKPILACGIPTSVISFYHKSISRADRHGLREVDTPGMGRKHLKFARMR